MSHRESAAGPVAERNDPANWSAVIALALGAFALVASEFMPVSLLTPLAAEFHISEGRAGLAISVSGAFALLTSLYISRLAGRVDRKHVLMAFTLLMLLSGAMAALASGYATFMVARAFIGVAVGGFWSMSAATAMRLVPAQQVPKALAIVNAGNALATVVAAPLGSYLGALVGWRGAFAFLVPVAAIALIWKAVSMPVMKPQRAAAGGSALALLGQPRVALGMIAVSLFFAGQFTLYTYLRPYLEVATKLDAASISLLLLLIGLAGVAGTALIGAPLRKHLFVVLACIPALMAAVALALTTTGANVAPTATLLVAWGFLATAAPVGWWTWLARTLPRDAEAGGGLMVAVVQVAIALGATAGGFVYDHSGYQATFAVSAGLLLAASAIAMLASRQARQQSPSTGLLTPLCSTSYLPT